MQNYPKQILSIKQQVQSLKDAGMSIPSDEEAEKYLQKVGYYRLRGYTYTFYNNTSKQYRTGTDFINHDGKIPLWAAVEVLSFGTLSRIIKNLNTGNGSAFAKLSNYYKFKSKKGNLVTPSNSTLTSWIKSLVILRNTCAHNARIYNKPFNITPEIIKADKVTPQPSHSGLYELVLAMKYLRPDNSSWEDFSTDLKQLISEYSSHIKLSAMNFPSDWEDHLNITA